MEALDVATTRAAEIKAQADFELSIAQNKKYQAELAQQAAINAGRAASEEMAALSAKLANAGK